MVTRADTCANVAAVRQRDIAHRRYLYELYDQVSSKIALVLTSARVIIAGRRDCRKMVDPPVIGTGEVTDKAISTSA